MCAYTLIYGDLNVDAMCARPCESHCMGSFIFYLACFVFELRMRLAASGQRSAALPDTNAVYLPFKKSNAGVRLLHNSCPPRWYCALFRRPFWRPLRLLRISGPLSCLVYKTCSVCMVYLIVIPLVAGGKPWKHSAHE